MDTRVREQERSVNQMHGLLSEKLAGGSQVEKIREKKKQCSTTHVAVKGVQTEWRQDTLGKIAADGRAERRTCLLHTWAGGHLHDTYKQISAESKAHLCHLL